MPWIFWCPNKLALVILSFFSVLLCTQNTIGVLTWFKAEMFTNLNTMLTVFGHIHQSVILFSHSFSWSDIKCSKANTFWNWWSLDSIFHLSAAAWWSSCVTGVCNQLVCYYLRNIHHTTLSTLFHFKTNLNILLWLCLVTELWTFCLNFWNTKYSVQQSLGNIIKVYDQEMNDQISLKAERIVQLIQWQAMGWMPGILVWFKSVLGSLFLLRLRQNLLYP